MRNLDPAWGTACACLVAVAILVGGCGGASDPAAGNRAPSGLGRLTIKTGSGFDVTYYEVEFYRGDTLVRTKYRASQNHHKDESVAEGDLSAPYMVATGRAPSDPADLDSEQKLVDAIRAAGYRLTKYGETCGPPECKLNTNVYKVEDG